MNTKYNNPRVEKYFPIEGRADFFKFAVMDGDQIAEGYDNKPLIFQDEAEAQRIVKSRIKVNKLNADFEARQNKKPSKYKYYLVIQEFYGRWEDVVHHDANSSFDALDPEYYKGDLKAHRQNAGVPVRVIKRKELNPQF